jgi:putative heme iron utilization protein
VVSPPDPWFDSRVLDAIVEHMNAEHRDDSLTIVRALGGRPSATAATLARLDPTGVVFDVQLADGATDTVVVAWQNVPAERADVRHELVRMTEESQDSR